MQISSRISDPGPIPAGGDADQPVTIPQVGSDPGAPAEPANTLAEEFKRVTSASDGLQGGARPGHPGQPLSTRARTVFGAQGSH